MCLTFVSDSRILQGLHAPRRAPARVRCQSRHHTWRHRPVCWGCILPGVLHCTGLLENHIFSKKYIREFHEVTWSTFLGDDKPTKKSKLLALSIRKRRKSTSELHSSFYYAFLLVTWHKVHNMKAIIIFWAMFDDFRSTGCHHSEACLETVFRTTMTCTSCVQPTSNTSTNFLRTKLKTKQGALLNIHHFKSRHGLEKLLIN